MRKPMVDTNINQLKKKFSKTLIVANNGRYKLGVYGIINTYINKRRFQNGFGGIKWRHFSVS